MQPSDPASAAPSQNILVLVNGPAGNIMAPRARHLFGDRARIVFKDRGRLGSITAFWNALARGGYRWIYAIDMGFPQVLLAALRRRANRSIRLAVDTGDLSRPLLKNQGRPWLEVAIAHQHDRYIPRVSDLMVFRSSYAARYFDEIAPGGKIGRWLWIPDGADMNIFRPKRDDPAIRALRAKHGLENRFVVGLVGSIHYNPLLNLFYGWELSEALARLPADLPVTGVVVGAGPGLSTLEATRDRLGLGDRLRLVGRVPHEEVASWMNVFDVALSTQTNDPVGWCRTTAKIPEYLACGTAVLSSDVGEAHRWLSDSGQTVPYEGMRDESYPGRLAERIRGMLPSDLDPLRRRNRELALRLFDYEKLRDRARIGLQDAETGAAWSAERAAAPWP